MKIDLGEILMFFVLGLIWGKLDNIIMMLKRIAR